MKRPSAVPWNTRFPAVVRVPPFHGATYSARQASFCFTGSHDSRRPNAGAFGGVAFSMKPTLQPEAPPNLPGVGAFWVNVFSGVRFNGTFCAGRYTRPVCGLNDIGCQLSAPNGPPILS